MPEATARICDWIRHIAAYQRAPQKYHHTVSRAWVEIVAHHVAADPDCADFETFAGRHPALLDKRLLSRHYRSSTLAADPARHGWVEPDLLPFPWTPLLGGVGGAAGGAAEAHGDERRGGQGRHAAADRDLAGAGGVGGGGRGGGRACGGGRGGWGGGGGGSAGRGARGRA